MSKIKTAASVVLIAALCSNITALASVGDWSLWYNKLPSVVAENSIGYNSSGDIYKELYVSTDGKDTNSGSKSKPVQSIKRVQELVRNYTEYMYGDVVVHIGEGTYFVDDVLDFTPADSGKNGYDVVYVGERGKTVLSAGKKITGFRKSSLGKGIYETTVSGIDSVSDLYINGERKRLAASERMIFPQTGNANGSYSYDDMNTAAEYDGLFVNKADIDNFSNIEDVVLVWDREYETLAYPIKELKENPDNNEQYIVVMRDIWNEYYSTDETARQGVNAKAGFRIVNALELLDSQGEFYFDKEQKKLYYIPCKGEDLATAEIIIPKEESILRLEGEGVGKEIENITFENISFAHSKWTRWLNGGSFYSGIALENGKGLLNLMNTPSAAVLVSFADNVNFKNDDFYNIGGTAIDAGGYINSSLIGNTFSNIGCQAIRCESLNYNYINKDTGIFTIGVPNATLMSHDSSIDTLAMSGVKVDASYNSMVDCFENAYAGGDVETTKTTGLRVLMDAMSVADYSHSPRKTRPQYVETQIAMHNLPEGAWKSDPDAPSRGEKSWVRYDLGKKYTLKEVTLGFNNEYVTDAEKSNYEVLLSDDMNFESYVTLATQEAAPTAEVIKYPVSDANKYRYVMIRTLGATPLALSGAWIMSNDILPYSNRGRCDKLNIANNYITNVGANISAASAICLGYVNNCRITNNEICDTPYNGISIGEGGSGDKYSSSYNYVAFNKVTNTNTRLQDGSALYLCGDMNGSVIEGNVIDDINLAQFGYYADNGASRALWIDNISEGTVYSYSFYLNAAGNATKQNIGRNMYANTNLFRNAEQSNSAENNDLDTVKVIAPGEVTEGTYSIRKNSGLKNNSIKQYAKTADINSNIDYYYYKYYSEWYSPTFIERHKDALVQAAQGIINSDKFGDGLGEYASEYKYKLSDLLNVTDFESLYKLDRMVEMAKESVTRYEMAELIQLAEAVANKPAILTSAINNAKANDTFNTFIALENAYNAVKDTDCVIDYVYVEGANYTDINNSSKMITAYIPINANIADARYTDVVAKDGYTISNNPFNNAIALNTPVAFSVGGESWTIKAEYETAQNLTGFGTSSAWNTENDAVINEACILKANMYPYFAKGYNTGDRTGISFVPYAGRANEVITFVLGASDYNSPDWETQKHYKIIFADSMTFLYVVSGNNEILAGVSDKYLKIGEENILEYDLEALTNTNRLSLYLNGELIFNKAVHQGFVRKYLGIYTDESSIMIL